ncbi:CDK-activating kinase assembly factor MAT1 [Drechmeria coniospora]|uniref:RNA polymerase II transcription factor B subunit 3 n=1 Tax=Drechmeria coniospora TaxID=98403 RepID=A0A151GJN2_DRECN|nr:CDK-activating kinase assembly factor MAT1 [Drechmeria coniospora]KYK57310.1 CDK-activating kinase assembly factor MAT1 [Drechmeria coniospora]ODA79204.1 hypothetical protein RJ55_04796 [Drechmeria coniospora]
MSRPGGSMRSNDVPPSLDQDETCPVCKTTRYFNKDMEFRINTECYHRMCKTCVERIFKDGPNQCPYAGCHRTLRLRGFKTAFFADLRVEREVDVRRRVAQVFNKGEDDFESLEAYNDYLYMVECLTDDLVNGPDEAKKKAEGQLAEWETLHKAEIERNRKLARESDDARQKRLAAEKDAARHRRMLDIQAQADEKASHARLREEVLNTLASAEVGHATEAVDKVLLKKRGQQKRDAVSHSTLSTTGLSIRGLRDKTRASDANKLYDPFGGLYLAPERVEVSSHELLLAYHSEWIDAVRSKDDYLVGGYGADEYISRVLFDTFSGLGVFVANEEENGSVAGAPQSVSVVPTVSLNGHG